jgi:adenylate cyclase
VRLSISGLLLLVCSFHIAGTPRLKLIDRVENYLYDVRVRMTMPGTVDDRIVIIDIDEASQAELGQWPWPRNTLAAMADRLFDDYGIQVHEKACGYSETSTTFLMTLTCCGPSP